MTKRTDPTPNEGADVERALRELVELKDMKDRLRVLHESGHGTDYDDYHRRQPLAWEAARRALAQAPKGPGTPLTDNDKFEIKALAFYKMTGVMAPGKDAPAGLHQPDFSERSDLYVDWLREHSKVIDSLLKATEEIL